MVKPKKRTKLSTIILILVFLVLISYGITRLVPYKFKDYKDKIVFIPIKGLILVDSTNQPFIGSVASSTKIVEFINQAEKDKTVKGIIFEINSPGGAVVATEEIANAVKAVEKPKVAWIREVGASGAYWIASATDLIIADPLSITGSIGVTGSYLEFSELFEKYGISYERVVAGEYKDTGSPYKKLTDKERELLQGKVGIIHEVFIEEVARNRGLNIKTTRELSNGMFYLGKEAKELNLVDYLGNKDLAINLTKQLAGIKEAKLVKYEEKNSLFDILRKISVYFPYYIGMGIGSELYGTKQDFVELRA
jgi:protease-4